MRLLVPPNLPTLASPAIAPSGSTLLYRRDGALRWVSFMSPEHQILSMDNIGMEVVPFYTDAYFPTGTPEIGQALLYFEGRRLRVRSRGAGGIAIDRPMAEIVNTDGQPGNTIYVGNEEPSGTLAPGDVWLTPSGQGFTRLLLPDGTQPDPAYSFANSPGTGIYRTWSLADPSIHGLGLSVQGQMAMAASADGRILAGGSGDESATAFSFNASGNTGMYRSGTTLCFSVVGSRQLGILTSGRIRAASDGTQGTPTYAFDGASGAGMYHWGSGNLGLTAGSGSQVLVVLGTTLIAQFRPVGSTTTVVFNDHATTTTAANVHMAASGNFYRSTSSVEFKRDIKDLGKTERRNQLQALRPRKWREDVKRFEDKKAGRNLFSLMNPAIPTWDDELDGLIPLPLEHEGFVAEEVYEVDPRLAIQDPETGEPIGVDPLALCAVLVDEVREQQAKIASLEDRLVRLEALVGEGV